MPGKEDTYHWALIVGPKTETDGSTGVRYHAKEWPRPEGGSTWLFEERSSRLLPSSMILVRIMVGKVIDRNRLVESLRIRPIRQGEPGWNCVSWVKEALEALETDKNALGSSVLEWDKIRNTAMEYCQRKKGQHRFDGQGQFDKDKVPTYDLMERKEIIV
ncbi:hypothetical protein HFD88_006571 [Aspergillus terreus]|nr:hypothetical protein HFD88_006571 [Aspergillus terreus]